MIEQQEEDEEDDIDLKKFVKCDIFTPDNISKIMQSKLLNFGSLLEPSVGAGNLLKNLNLNNYNSIDVYEIKKEYLDKISDNKIKKYNKDFIKSNINIDYNNIILNPPYIKMQDLSVSYRKYIKNNFNELKTGLVDIYYAFILKSLKLLKDDGVMVSITPNSFLFNKSAIKLRKYLFENKYIEEIIDFKHTKVFNNVSVYCCITVFTKKSKESLIYNNEIINYDEINKNYSLFNFTNNKNNLKKLCKITNGIATLRDKIYIHKNKLNNEECWKPITNGNETKYIIFPYVNGKIIDEKIFKEKNPKTYEFLQKNKEELSKRDKGKKKYPTWYAYGRSQSIIYPTKKSIYIPCFINPINIKELLYIKDPILYQNCLCIEPNNSKDINLIKNLIIKNIKFIEENSAKRSGGWINISSRILYQISID